jgi:hypothetical protein
VVLLCCSGFSFEDRQFNLVRKHREMDGEPIKHLALGFVSCEIADQSAFGCVFPKLLDLRQLVFHCRPPLLFFRVSLREQAASTQLQERAVIISDRHGTSPALVAAPATW